MQRLLVLVVAAALGLLAIVVSAPTLAQTAPGTLEACRGTQARVQASALPEVVAPGRCPLEGGVIVDNGVGTVVPEPGEAIYAEAMTTSGAQELTVTRSENGTIALDSVGDDTTAQAEAAMDAATQTTALGLATARAGGGCSDSAFISNNWRVAKFMRYAVNVRSIPSELRKRSAIRAISKGGRNIYNTNNSCGFRDRVPARLIYTGNTRSSANINSNTTCSRQNGKSVIGFGTLPRNYTSFYCMVTGARPGPDRPIAKRRQAQQSVQDLDHEPQR